MCDMRQSHARYTTLGMSVLVWCCLDMIHVAIAMSCYTIYYILLNGAPTHRPSFQLGMRSASCCTINPGLQYCITLTPIGNLVYVSRVRIKCGGQGSCLCEMQ